MCSGIVLVGAGSGILALHGAPRRSRDRIVSFEKNVDRQGGADYSHFDSPTIEVCAEACISDARCKAFSFDVAGRECWLKADVPLAIDSAGFVSAVKVAR